MTPSFFQVGDKELIHLLPEGLWGARDKTFHYQAQEFTSRGFLPRIQFASAKPLPPNLQLEIIREHLTQSSDLPELVWGSDPGQQFRSFHR